MKKSIVLFLILFAALATFSQDVKFIASARQTVSLGEQFYVKYSVNAEGSSFKGPSFKGFDLVSGPNSSSSSSVQIINGKVSQSLEITFTYILYASKEGSFNIPSATILVNGKIYSSNSLSIQVVKGKGGNNNQQQNQQQNQSSGSDESIFIRAVSSNSKPMLGEQVIVTYKLYTTVPVVQYSITKAPSYNGFWSYDLLKDKDKPKQYNEDYDGKRYMVAEIRKVALFPQKSGSLKIDPLDVEAVVQIQQKRKHSNNDFFDDFFYSGVQNVKRTLSSNSVNISALPLPSNNKPADFSGAVGTFTLKSSVTNNTVKANEAINIKFTISGKGNLKLIDKMNINFPPDFEVYDPKITENISTTSGVVSGTKTFDYLIIPRNKGKFTIEPVLFSYFDLDKKAYSTLSSQNFVFDILKGDGQTNTVVSSVNQEDIKYIGTDIRHIKTRNGSFSIVGSSFYSSTMFYLAFAIPFILFFIIVVFLRDYINKQKDLVFVKNKRATKIARLRLQKAGKMLESNQKQDFYEEISLALWGYMNDKFNIPLSELSLNIALEELMKKGIDIETTNSFANIINNCEYARFAPSAEVENTNSIYSEAIEIITKIENKLH